MRILYHSMIEGLIDRMIECFAKAHGRRGKTGSLN